MKRVIPVLLVVVLAAAPAAAAEKPAVEIPVTRVVLFSSGVGYFEHTGNVEGDAVTRLMFKTDEINDVLKSMVVTDAAGTVTSVTYASRAPLVRALRSFAVDISGDPDLGNLLRQLRGAEVVIEAPDKIAGKILGVEAHKKTVAAGGTTTIITEVILNIVTPKGIKAVPLGTVQNLQLADEKLQVELNKALSLLIGSNDKERKPVEVHFAGKGKRGVRIGYIAETPVWKTSYRLDLSGEKPFLQGWAIVENTSEVDWSQVRLALVSGRPISFIQDLYTPLYMPRPVVRPQLYASLRPRIYDEGIEAREKTAQLAKAPGAPKPSEAAAKRMDSLRAGRALAEAKGYAAGLATGAVRLEDAVRSVATAGKVGELFHFALKEPVDMPRRRSAMLPIINAPIKAEQVSIYNAAVMPKHPLNGAYLINTTGMKMLGGPVTVFDDGMYAGDAQIDSLVPGDKRLISYAVDLNVTVVPSGSSRNRITSAKIVRGVLQVSRLLTYERSYAIKNKADAKRTVIVEHPYRSGNKLVEPAKYEEKTASLYRFRVPVDKGATKTLTVKERRTLFESISILQRPSSTLVHYSRTGEIAQPVRDALAKVIEMKNALAVLQGRLNSLRQRLAAIKAGQGRLRENIKVVGNDSTLGKRYLKKLSDEEDQIETLEAQIDDLRKQVEAKQAELADHVKNLNVG